MRKLLLKRLRSRPVSSAVLLLGALCLTVIAVLQAVGWSSWSLFTAHAWAASIVGNLEQVAGPVFNGAIAPSTSSPARTVLPYTYRGRTLFVDATVPSAEAAIARSLPTENVFSSRGMLRSAYLRALVAAAQSDPVVAGVCTQLRATRDELGLGSDEYVELIVRFVQQIPYGPVRERIGTPATVIADGHGVCADKSVLLASLLVHEGYASAVVAIDSNRHAAAAVRGTGSAYLGSGYAYVETTSDAFIGEVPPIGQGLGAVSDRAEITPVGGVRRYQSDLESEFLGETVLRALSTARTLKPYAAYAAETTGDSRRAFAALAERHVEAAQLARALRLSADDRARTYALMTRSGGR